VKVFFHCLSFLFLYQVLQVLIISDALDEVVS